MENNGSNGNGKLRRDRWKNRRRMAWTAMFNITGYTALLLFYPFSPEKLEVAKTIADWYYIANVSVVGAYMGFTSWASK